MVGTGQFSSLQDCQAWGQPVSIVGGVALLDGLSRHRPPWFRRPTWDDSSVSSPLIDVVHVLLMAQGGPLHHLSPPSALTPQEVSKRSQEN